MADLEMCEKYGFDYIEIRFDCVKDYLKEHTLEELADWFKNHHLKPWAYNTLIFFNQRDEAGEKEIDEEVDFILKVSKAIGMKMLITVPSFDVKDKSVSEDLPLGSCGDDKRLWPGEGVVDHAGIAAALKAIGFDGVCTIEEFRPEYYAMSHEDNVKKAAEVTRDFVQKYFG